MSNNHQHPIKKENSVFFENSESSKVVIRGGGNVVDIKNKNPRATVNLTINGDNNKIIIGDSILKNLSITLGSHQRITGAEIVIGNNFSIEPGCVFDVFTDFAKIKIGDRCMFSRNIYLRYGDNPHLIFDLETGEYLDGDGGISIGDKVWVGEGVFLSKRAVINDESIVAARSVVTRNFVKKNCVIAGNPAVIVKEGIQWFRNRQHVPSGSKYDISIKDYDSLVKVKKESDDELAK
ncbi:acyltransferase [Halomonas sp. KHS3]|uniref:acyltransferase n=1 Tax=Halomonas sp. KHS3 TaxID=866350 RepID=UPI00059B2180|nr:acyltransferase [Halomonas sp. KHS3]KIN16402.1 hypothetical protein RO22_07375 [Halomonas sp. KHS3]